MSHVYLPVCLLKLFSLVWVVSLFLFAFSLPSLHILHCLFLVGGFLFVGYDRMPLDNFSTLIWLKFGFCFGRPIPPQKNVLTGLDLNWTFVLACFCSLLSRWLDWSFWLLFWGLFWYLSLGIWQHPVGTRRNGRFLAIWTHPHGRARPLLCSSNAHSCSGRTRSLSSSSH